MADVIERRKVGRPARLDRDMIAKAAHEVGLDRVTMKAVADRLGVSVPGLYHHIEGRDDLMRLAAEYSASRIPLPVDRGQHWTEWLLEWAQYSHDAFVAQPELLGQFLHGSISAERMVTSLDTIMGLLMRHGFTPTEARDAYMIVAEAAVGAAVSEIREAEAARNGRPAVAEYHRALAQHGPDEFPNLRALVSAASERPDFADRVRTVLIGIAVQRSESPSVVDDTEASSSSAPDGLGSLHH
jgi:AcrR family transcriptional regulator